MILQIALLHYLVKMLRLCSGNVKVRQRSCSEPQRRLYRCVILHSAP